MPDHEIVSRERWIEARKQLLAQEKELTRLQDQLSRARRELPWVRVDEEYVFDTTQGAQTLAQLFDGRSQLIVYHFMYGPDWEAGCKSCSFWADNFNGVQAHLRERDISLIAASRAPLDKIEAYRKRLGWQFKWVSSLGSDFNYDYAASFTPEQMSSGKVFYNFTLRQPPGSESPGLSVFYKDDRGGIFHTYSCYARGLEVMNGAYHLMDLAPKGRDEDALPYTMAWLRRRDEYET